MSDKTKALTDRPEPTYTGRLLATAAEDPYGPGVDVWVRPEVEGERRRDNEFDVTNLLRDGEDRRDLSRRLEEALPPIDPAAMLAEAIEAVTQRQREASLEGRDHVRESVEATGDYVAEALKWRVWTGGRDWFVAPPPTEPHWNQNIRRFRTHAEAVRWATTQARKEIPA